MNKYAINWEKYASVARQVVAEGCVLLKNDKQALPIREGEKVSVFGRIQLDYYKSGTGSGGMVNTRYVVNILDGLKNSNAVNVNEQLEQVYREWADKNPFDKGEGWGLEPWCQVEMPVSDKLAKEAAAVSDIALFIIGRTAGEDKDNSNTQGSYLLTEEEERVLEVVRNAFNRVVVLLNTGNIMDMKWVDKYNPDAVVYTWQGGMEGGNGVADILTGKVNPCGKLSDTIAYDIQDYPSTDQFGNTIRDIYTEDIYVGYRYFETFAKDKVLYPFGYGMSYTNYSCEISRLIVEDTNISVWVKVTNTGKIAGKEVIQVYVQAPQGRLGKPARNLVAFAKTKVLEPDESEELVMTVDKHALASYDDSGITGYKSCYVLEAGIYQFYAGADIRSAAFAGSFTVEELIVTEQLSEACAPVIDFERLKPVQSIEGDFFVSKEKVPLRTINPMDRIQAGRSENVSFTGDKGYQLGDVLDKKVSMETFLSQLTDEDLACISRGEGMCSPKVTPGTAAAFGGVTDRLQSFGIPAACCTDGPSGLRMDCGTFAFSLPNGTAMACTFNLSLIEELFEYEGKEMRKNRIDSLLGPGMNIHRNPLNGRNFEYFSEDPYLTGVMAAAQLQGMHKWGVTGTIKHFAGNNQEFQRRKLDSVISERALREIYLRGFEIAVKEAGAYCIMTTYGAINGLWTAGNYDLVTTILRKEWGFDGLVMSDWWAEMNDEGCEASIRNTTAMVRAQNDLFMVTTDSLHNAVGDNTLEGLADGRITRVELIRNAANICNVILRSPVMQRHLGRLSEEELMEANNTDSLDYVNFDLIYQPVADEAVLDITTLSTKKDTSAILGIAFQKKGIYCLNMKVRSFLNEVAQIPVSIFMNSHFEGTISINGTGGEWITREQTMAPITFSNGYLKLYFGQSGMEIGELKLTLIKEME